MPCTRSGTGGHALFAFPLGASQPIGSCAQALVSRRMADSTRFAGVQRTRVAGVGARYRSTPGLAAGGDLRTGIVPFHPVAALEILDAVGGSCRIAEREAASDLRP